MIPGLIEGRMVHFVPPALPGWRNGGHIPAVVVRVWDKEHGKVNLRLLMDGLNDHMDYTRHEWQTSVMYDETDHKPGTWHYPERVE